MYGKKLRELRKIEGWTQEDVANKLGITKQTYSHYENEKRKPGLDMIKELASVYQVEIDDIFAEESFGDTVSLPIVGKISSKAGSFVFDNIERYESTPKEWVVEGEHFYLRAKGDSMTGARVYDGDLLLIKKQQEIENGEIAVVLIDDSTEAVLKRIYINGDQMVLQSENPNYQPVFSPPAEVKIIGKLKMNVIKF